MEAGPEITRQVIDILLDPIVSRIHFRVEGIPVYGSGYATIARAIEGGHIVVKLVPLPEGVGAQYRSRTNYQGQARNKLVIRPDFDRNSPNSRKNIIHEATHALADYHRAPVSAYHEEAASYIAGAVYKQLKYGTELECHTSPVNPMSIFVMAARAARKLLRRRLYDVPREDLAPVISMIRRNSVYSTLTRDTEYLNDGF